MVLASCGREPHVVTRYVENPTPPVVNPGTGGGTSDVTYAEMQTLLVEYCVACHSNSPFMQSEGQLLSSSAKDRVWSRTMPPSNAAKKLPENVRQKMLVFFQ